MARLSLITFLALAFSGLVFAAPQDLGASGDIRARDAQKYYDCGTWVPASKDPTRGIYGLVVQGALTQYCHSLDLNPVPAVAGEDPTVVLTAYTYSWTCLLEYS